jgi:hypothetical protein
MEDEDNGVFRFREPPKTNWSLEQLENGRPVAAIIGAKGLVPVLSIYKSNQSNIVIPDIVEIGGIEDLRARKLFNEAVSLAYTHSDFQGKRIIALLNKEGLTHRDKNIFNGVCKKFKCNPNRIGRWSFACVTEVLFGLADISKDEYDTLNGLRVIRNRLQHQSVAKYTMATERVDSNLKKTIQVLMRLRETPFALSVKITGYEFKEFWEDLGFGGANQFPSNKLKLK